MPTPLLVTVLAVAGRLLASLWSGQPAEPWRLPVAAPAIGPRYTGGAGGPIR